MGAALPPVPLCKTGGGKAGENGVRSLRRPAESSSRPQLVLVMCYGNICRSPFAAGRLHAMLSSSGILVESAGLYGPGRSAPLEAQAAARARGVELRDHSSRLVTAKQVAGADLIIVMEAFQARSLIRDYGATPDKLMLLGDLDPMPIRTRRIQDPEGQSLDVFSDVYSRIERCLRSLTAAVDAPT